MIDEENAVEMVNLVLQAGGEQPVRLDLLLLAIEVEIAHPHTGRPLHFLVIFGNRQAAFLVGARLLRRPDDLGVDEDHRALFLALARDVEHDEALQDADLHRGKADAGCSIHRLQHVLGQPADLVGHRLDGLGALLQAGIGNDDDGTDGHGTRRILNIPAK